MTGFPSNSSVSVVIPVFNGESFIADAINSVLNQSVKAQEVIVVDDGSIDRTRSIVQSYADRVRIVSGVHAGSWSARNRGVHEARGEILLFQDADDIAHPRRVETQVAALNGDLDPALVFGMMTEFHDGSGFEPFSNSDNLIRAVCPGALALKRETFFQIGEFPTENELSSFIDWFMRVSDNGYTHHVVAAPVLARRVHGANTTNVSNDERGKVYLRTIRAGLERRRAEA